jgi:hypothetical protein
VHSDRLRTVEALSARLVCLATGETAEISIEALEWVLGAPLEETLPRFASPEAFDITIDRETGQTSITAR